MDSYLEKKFVNGDKIIDPDRVKNCHNQLNIISNNNIKKWFEINSRDIRKYICDDIIEKLENVFSSNLTFEEKKIIFFYTLHFQRKLELDNFQIKGERDIKISLRDSNRYSGVIDDKNVNVYFIYPNRKLERIYQVYKIYQLYKITSPIIYLNYTCSGEKLLVIQDLKEVKVFSGDFFIQILNILRQLNKNNYYVHLNLENLKTDGENFFIVNLEELKNSRNCFKKQIDRLQDVTGVKLSVRGNSYDSLILKLISKKNFT